MAEEKAAKHYIRYTEQELARVASPAQMERELEQVCEEFGLGLGIFRDIVREYKLLQALGRVGYARQRRLEAEALRGRNSFGIDGQR
jgi:hypothetical protein